MDAKNFIEIFQDRAAPLLDVYEQAVYLYLIRHSLLIGQEEATIGFKSARKKLAFGIGKKGTAPSEGVIYEKLRSLSGKGFIEIIGTKHSGTHIRIFPPEKVVSVHEEVADAISIEDMDFCDVVENRKFILSREEGICFYCLRKLDNTNWVIEHVVSRPNGNNSYKNVVAACRNCNNKKGKSHARDYVRQLYRNGILNEVEMAECFQKLERLALGKMLPVMQP